MRFNVSIKQDQSEPIIVLSDSTTGCTAELYAFGGLLNALTIPVNGKSFNCIDGFNTVEEAKNNITAAFKSAKLSPFVCRLSNGSYDLNEQKYTVKKNYLGAHALHGLIYDAVYTLGNTVASEESAAINLHYHYAKNDPGYPFTFDVSICWELCPFNLLNVTTTISHQNDQPIPFADGWHPYFTLGNSIDECTLQFDSDCQLEFDETLIPTGKKITDDRFLQKHSLAHIFLDNSYELAPDGKCVFSNKQLQLTVLPDKHYPILQVYTPEHRNSIAIENLSGAPDNFNNGIGLLMLVPNEVYQFKTSYQIELL